jgi:linoleoyl-CoA desaturase
MNTPKFTSPALPIYSVFKDRIYEYFNENKITTTGNITLYLKATVLLISYISVYLHLVFFTPVVWIALPECVLLGLLTAGIGFNIMHDGAHGSFSKSTGINRSAALTIDFLGASSFMWHSKHNIIHHTYTNINGVDDDIEAKPFLRLAPAQKHSKVHRYQHLYFWFLYGLLYFLWVFYTDYKKYFSGKVGDISIRKMKMADHITFWSFKVLYFLMYIILPIYLIGLNAWIAGFITYSFISGLVLSTVFQLAHTVNETSFPKAIQPSNKIADEWAVHQLKTTANFATKNKIITWYVGGLNYQIEHHLFPKISHVHYPAISKIIKELCINLRLPYIEHEKMTGAIASHIIHLKKLGAC